MEVSEPMRQRLNEMVHNHKGEADARAARAERRAKYWLTGLAVCTRVAKLREYIGKINAADVKFLRYDPNIHEATHNLHALAQELLTLANALEAGEEVEQLEAKRA